VVVDFLILWFCFTYLYQSLLLRRDINNSEELKQFLGYESDPSIAFAQRCVPKSLPRIDKVTVLIIIYFYCLPVIIMLNCIMLYRGVRNPMKISDIGFLKTEPNRPQNSKTKNSVSAVRFSKNRYLRFRDGFSRCLIYNSSSNMMNFVSFSFGFACVTRNRRRPNPYARVHALDRRGGVHTWRPATAGELTDE